MRISHKFGVAYLVLSCGIACAQTAEPETPVRTLTLALTKVHGNAAAQDALITPVFKQLKTTEEKVEFLDIAVAPYGPFVLKEVFVPYIGPLLRDPDATVRQKALHAVARYQSDAYVTEVEALCADANKDVRIAATYALQFGGMKEFERLRRTIETPESPDIRDMAIYAVGGLAWNQTGADRAMLLAYLAGFLDDNALKVTALRALIAAAPVESDRGILSRVGALTADSNMQVRQVALDGIVRLKATSEMPSVLSLLDSQDLETRLQAIKALRELHDLRGTSALLTLLDDPELPIRTNAIFSLGQSGDLSVAPALAARLTEPDANIRRVAMNALINLKAEAFFPDIKAMSDDPDRLIRGALVRSIRQLYSREEAAPAAARMLEDADYYIRSEAITMLMSLKAWDQREAVRKMAAAETVEWVQAHAQRFLDDAAKESP